MGFYPAGAAEHNECSLYLSSAEGREAPGCCRGWEWCVFAQEELVLYILAHMRRYKQNLHLLMKDQPAWKRCRLERKHIFKDRSKYCSTVNYSL